YFFSLLLYLVSVGAFAQDAPEPDDAKRDLAATKELVTVRGKVVGAPINMYYLETVGGPTYLIVKPPASMREFLDLNVEIKGWTSGYEGIFIVQPAQIPRILVPAWWSVPFLLLLACIAIVPFINKHFWDRHFHHIALALGVAVVTVYLARLGGYGQYRIKEVALDYFKFIALIGSLFIVTGGILIDISGRGAPFVNTVLLAAGALLANIFGTTGAAMLLIRPFLRINQGRLRPFHVVMFIFIVANCGGALTPIGDPPLFLGYLCGVPFSWTIFNCWPAWALTVGLLLFAFFIMDSLVAPKEIALEKTRVKISGAVNFVCLAVVVFGVFIDKLLEEYGSSALKHYPLGAVVMLMAAGVAYWRSNHEILTRNEFAFGPIREVAYLFLGIFATMPPALDYLAANATLFGIVSPGDFYFVTGALSGVLDNAPTYLNFLTTAHGLKEIPLAKEQMPLFINQHSQYLLAISLSSVFFGACTYIGNGPNFMIKAIAETSGAQMPSFFGYIIKYALPLLIPIYVLVWWLFLRT
ncbi:MAG: sodium:proton antiporter, partial [Planctomycetota bacterium]